MKVIMSRKEVWREVFLISEGKESSVSETTLIDFLLRDTLKPFTIYWILYYKNGDIEDLDEVIDFLLR